MYENIKEMLIKNEGLVLQVYKDSLGYDTIGVGRCLDKNGISEDEAMYLLENDINRVVANLDKVWEVWRSFPVPAQEVCVDMAFQLGITGFMNFRQTRALMEMGCWLEASEEVLRSKYAVQTPNRAARNSRKLALCQNAKKDIRSTSK
jgi:lysozyme